MKQVILEKNVVKLSNACLQEDFSNISKPLYDRSKLSAGIVHIGLGNFHRAHQAWYIHQLMQRGEALNWAIVGAGIRLSLIHISEPTSPY